MCTHLSSLLRGLKLMLEKYDIDLDKCAGQGSFGIVIPGKDRKLNADVAFKVECGDTAGTRNEVAAYTLLNGVAGIPKFYQAVSFQGHGILVIERLGCCLETFMHSSGGSLPIRTVFTLGWRLVRIIKEMHEKGVIHRDIKPHNILLPRSGELSPYLVDFGLADPHADVRTKEGADSSVATGTPTFMSQPAHQQKPISRFDDIASLSYTLIYLAHGSLPWEHVSVSECLRQKVTFRVAELNPFLPHELQLFLDYATSLEDTQFPDYAFLEGLLH